MSKPKNAYTALILLLCAPHCVQAGVEKSLYIGYSQPGLDLTVEEINSDESSNQNLQSQAPSSEGHTILYGPRFPDILVIGGSYDWISASLSQDIDSGSENALDYTDYKLGVAFSWFGFDATYSYFYRFRIEESTGFSEDLILEEQFREDMALTFMGGNFYLFPLRFNFDYGESFDFSAEKSTGLGIGAIGSWNLLAIDTIDGIIPKPWQNAFGGDGKFERGELSGFNLQLALSGTLAIGPIYISALLAIGPGEHHFSYETDTELRSGTGFKTKLNERVMIGYAGKRFFTGLEVNQESPDYELKFMTLVASRSEFNLVFGTKWN